MGSIVLSSYERQIWELLNQRPDLTNYISSVSASQTISRPDGSKFRISYKLSVTVSKVES
jgi:hypothetical protein